MLASTKILVPIDFSPTAARAFRFALQVGGSLNAELHLLHVTYPQMEDIDHPRQPSAVATSSKKHLLEIKLNEFLTAEKTKWQQQEGVVPDTFAHVEVGGAIAVIKEWVKKYAYDLVVMGTRDKHESVENLLGTVASDVVGNASCPVIVVPQQFECASISRVAHAIEPEMVNIELVSETIGRYIALHREVHLIRFAKSDDTKPPQQLLQLKSSLNEIFPELDLKTHRLSKKYLVRDINQFVDHAGIDLLIMYRSSNSFFHRLFHRSRTRLMARYTHIPLLVV